VKKITFALLAWIGVCAFGRSEWLLRLRLGTAAAATVLPTCLLINSWPCCAKTFARSRSNLSRDLTLNR